MLNAQALMFRRGDSQPLGAFLSQNYRKDVSSGGMTITESVTVTIGSTEVTSDSDSFYAEDYTWVQNGVAADFQVRCDIVSGTVTGSSTGVWLSPVGQSWIKSKTGRTGTSTASLTLRLRRSSDFVEIDTASISLTVFMES